MMNNVAEEIQTLNTHIQYCEQDIEEINKRFPKRSQTKQRLIALCKKEIEGLKSWQHRLMVRTQPAEKL